MVSCCNICDKKSQYTLTIDSEPDFAVFVCSTDCGEVFATQFAQSETNSLAEFIGVKNLPKRRKTNKTKTHNVTVMPGLILHIHSEENLEFSKNDFDAYWNDRPLEKPDPKYVDEELPFSINKTFKWSIDINVETILTIMKDFTKQIITPMKLTLKNNYFKLKDVVEIMRDFKIYSLKAKKDSSSLETGKKLRRIIDHVILLYKQTFSVEKYKENRKDPVIVVGKFTRDYSFGTKYIVKRKFYEWFLSELMKHELKDALDGQMHFGLTTQEPNFFLKIRKEKSKDDDDDDDDQYPYTIESMLKEIELNILGEYSSSASWTYFQRPIRKEFSKEGRRLCSVASPSQLLFDYFFSLNLFIPKDKLLKYFKSCLRIMNEIQQPVQKFKELYILEQTFEKFEDDVETNNNLLERMIQKYSKILEDEKFSYANLLKHLAKSAKNMKVFKQGIANFSYPKLILDIYHADSERQDEMFYMEQKLSKFTAHILSVLMFHTYESILARNFADDYKAKSIVDDNEKNEIVEAEKIIENFFNMNEPNEENFSNLVSSINSSDYVNTIQEDDGLLIIARPAWRALFTNMQNNFEK